MGICCEVRNDKETNEEEPGATSNGNWDDIGLLSLYGKFGIL